MVDLLHNPSSQLLKKLKRALRDGKICILDTSQQRGKAGLILTGIILQEIFNHNQKEFTEADPKSIPTIAVLEEAQSVLGTDSANDSPYVAWVKEGRKYDLGSVMITQQPGSISTELLSQGDNWFSFHLLSASDLVALKKANAHFSDDLLSSLLNEPIPGNGIVWSSAAKKPYPIPVRVLNFEMMYLTNDKAYNQPEVETYAVRMRSSGVSKKYPEESQSNEESTEPEIDYRKEKLNRIIEGLANNREFIDKITNNGTTWKGVAVRISEYLEGDDSEKSSESYNLVVEVLDLLFPGKWRDEKRDSKSRPGEQTTWIVAEKPGEEPV